MKIRSIRFFTVISILSLLTITPGFLPVHATNNTISSTTVYNPVNFEGLNQTQSIGNDTAAGVAANPPDVSVAVGPNHIMESVNSVFGIYSKPQGTLLRVTALNTFFKVGATHFVFDPKVLYDASSQRWFASTGDCPLGVFSCNPSVVRIAVSTSSDPTQPWTMYSVNAPTNDFADQPIFGISDNVAVVTVNDFSGGPSGSFLGAQYWVFNKSQMVSGVSNVSNQTIGPDSTLFSVHPVQSLASTTTQYMVTSVNAVFNTTGKPANTIELFSITGTPPNISVTTTNFSVSTISPPPISQSSQPCCFANNINVDDARVTTAVWESGKLWLGLNDGCTPTGDSQTRDCIRLDQLNTSSMSLLQDFDFAVNGLYQYYPALRLDSSGNLGLIFGFSNSTTYPSLGLTGQLSTDPVNSLAKPVTLRSGNQVETSTRYGDYFGAGVDPSDTSVIWLAGEYHHTNNGSCNTGTCWFTAIGALTFFQPDFSVTGPSSGLCPQGGHCVYTVTISSIHYFSGTVSLTVTAHPAGTRITLSPTSVTISAGGTATSNVNINNAQAGTVTIQGTSGSLSHSESTVINLGG